jgi:uncharacterized membrane protein
VLFPAAQLVNARRGVRAFDRGVLALLILTPLVAVMALVLSRRRRRTLLQLTVGAMLGLVVVRRSTMWLEDKLVAGARPENREARTAIVHHVLDRFFSLTQWFLIGGLIIVAVALLTGPYKWAVATRSRVARGAHASGRLVSLAASGTAGEAPDDATVIWVRGHFDLLRAGGVVVAVLLLLGFSINVWGFLVIAALLALYEFGLYRLRPQPITLPPEPITLPPAPS